MRIENLPPKYWLASYKRETEAFHPHTKCILCDRVEKTLLLKCTCIIGTPTCNPCCQKYLLKWNKLFDLHRDKLLERMNSEVGGPVISVIPLPCKTKPQLTPGNRKRVEAWSNPKNTNIGDIIGLALKQYKRESPQRDKQQTKKRKLTLPDNKPKTTPKRRDHHYDRGLNPIRNKHRKY